MCMWSPKLDNDKKDEKFPGLMSIDLSRNIQQESIDSS